MKKRNKLPVALLLACLFISKGYAYHIELTASSLPNIPVFMVGYYGDRILIVDSVLLNNSGYAVFDRKDSLYTGMYTLVVPGKMMYDLLIDQNQSLKIQMNTRLDEARIEGNPQAAAYAGYLRLQSQNNKDELSVLRKQLILQNPGTFLATYLNAMQSVESRVDKSKEDGMGQLISAYQYRKRHFFDHINLSDARLLRTPLYHERIQYFFSKFLTQHADTLIYNSYRLLEQASGNYETFFYLSDYLIDFSLRSKIDNIHKLHNFLRRNRYMLGNNAIPLLAPKFRNMNFMIKEETLLKKRIEMLGVTDMEGHPVDLNQIRSKFKALYFWKSDCPRCLADVSKWQAALNKYHSRSLTGIAINTVSDVRLPENRILAYEPLCMNTSLSGLKEYEWVFFVNTYSKIVLTDSNGGIIGIFGSSASLDEFMSHI